MRVISGIWRTRKFNFPVVKGLRPTPDRLRETVFNWLQYDIGDSVCLDMFAGSGALGIEALSRGAKKVYFLEKNRKACQSINQTLQDFGATDFAVLNVDAMRFSQKIYFDMVFLDPPYNSNLLDAAVDKLIKDEQIDHNSLLCFDTNDRKICDNDKLNIIKQSVAGQAHIFLGRIKN